MNFPFSIRYLRTICQLLTSIFNKIYLIDCFLIFHRPLECYLLSSSKKSNFGRSPIAPPSRISSSNLQKKIKLSINNFRFALNFYKNSPKDRQKVFFTDFSSSVHLKCAVRSWSFPFHPKKIVEEPEMEF